MLQDQGDRSSPESFDPSSDPRFYAFYERESLSKATQLRFERIMHRLLALAARHKIASDGLNVLDIGCGAGAQTHIWAKAGHHVHGLDVNAPLIELAKQRARQAGLAIQFDVGTATALPYQDNSMDVCLLPELLEHVTDWQSCLNESIRVLRPNGLLFLSTTNVLCPVQDEFNLPLYSWYPGFVKRRCERAATTTRPELANYAKYPAVHWFSYYQLATYLSQRGVRCFDHFDLIEISRLRIPRRLAVHALRAVPLLRFLGYTLTNGTRVFGIKHAAA
jgi:2-polyprenyl-6-hydroxyphenyl methylase/3-demethylubiquinone-9 3-methyltransferase